MALAESHLPEAWDILSQWWPQVRQAELCQTGLLAIATLPQDETIQFLMTLIAQGDRRDAADALEAISLYQADENLWQRVRDAVVQRADAALQQQFDTLRLPTK